MALALGCAVPELDTQGAIVCGTNNLCPTGFRCELGRCCPGDAGASCPTLSRACVGTSGASFAAGALPSTCLPGAAQLYEDCSPRAGGNVCGAFSCLPRPNATATSLCYIPQGLLPLCATAASIGSSCWEGRGVCVGAVQLGFDPMGIFGRNVICVPSCSFPEGQAQAQCGRSAVCVRLSGLSGAVCVPDCRTHGCGSSATCDRSTGTCRQ